MFNEVIRGAQSTSTLTAKKGWAHSIWTNVTHFKVAFRGPQDTLGPDFFSNINTLSNVHEYVSTYWIHNQAVVQCKHLSSDELAVCVTNVTVTITFDRPLYIPIIYRNSYKCPYFRLLKRP